MHSIRQICRNQMFSIRLHSIWFMNFDWCVGNWTAKWERKTLCSALNVVCSENLNRRNPSKQQFHRHSKGSRWIEKKGFTGWNRLNERVHFATMIESLHFHVGFLFLPANGRLCNVSLFGRKYFALNHNKLLVRLHLQMLRIRQNPVCFHLTR